MARLAWTTDIHLNFLSKDGRNELCDQLAAVHPDVVLVGGDISEAHRFSDDLEAMVARLERPLYFVLGNHDFYGGTLARVRRAAAELAKSSRFLSYLPIEGVVSLSPAVALIGVDGWGDCRYGSCEQSPIFLNDFLLIEELTGLSATVRRSRLRALGDREATLLREKLSGALQTHGEIVMLTHVPPFREACWHQGKPSDDDWVPFFACKATGDVITELMSAAPDAHLTVLCGHTHGAGEAHPLPNVDVFTCGSDYRRPVVQALDIRAT